MSKHTSGPWLVHSNDRAFTIERAEAPKNLIATLPVHRLGSADRVAQLSEQAANARLIAQAPAMLTTLQGIEGRLHKLANGGGAKGKPTMGEIKQGMRAMRADARAILRATDLDRYARDYGCEGA